MCGIIGIINKNNAPVDLHLLAHLASTIEHRGPDDEGYFIDQNIGFYHKRLSIIDLKTGHQPMQKDDLTIVYNGEIYNYIELREDLIQKGYAFKTNSDTEVLLTMYKHYGTDFIKQLNGMFAFIIYDKKNNTIITARDHFGIKPLYYFRNENEIIFASEIKAILQHPDVDIQPNEQALQEYLIFQFLLEDTTLFRGIQKIIPGHYLTIDLSTMKFTSVKYWDPCFKVDNYHTEEYFIYELQRLLEDAVKIQLRSDVSVGTYLSGGIDSSIVTLLSAKYYDKQLKTFTGAFNEGPEFDETQYSNLVADKSGADPFIIYPTENQFIDLLPKLIYYLDEPVAGPGLFPQYMVSTLASQHVKVVLGGQGGDEIYGGYARYVIAYLEQAIKGAIFQTNEEGEHIVSLASIIPNLPYIRRYIPMLKEFWQKNPFESMERRYFHLLDRNGGSLEFYSDELQHHFNKELIFARFKELFNHPDTLSYYNKMTHFDMFASLPALLQVEDRMSMACSIESRVPLLDHRLVELVSSMPPAMKFNGAEMKYILKKAVKDFLPCEILQRKDKMGFPVPLHLWAKNNARGFIKDVLFSGASLARGIFNMNKVEKLIESERPFGRQLWGILCLELWFQTFFDNHKKRIRKDEHAVII